MTSCTTSANTTKILTRHVWQDAKERIDANRLSVWGKLVYRRRKETIERSFADAKQLHGHRYARFRGLKAMAGQCLLAADAQNIKTSRRSPWQSTAAGSSPPEPGGAAGLTTCSSSGCGAA